MDGIGRGLTSGRKRNSARKRELARATVKPIADGERFPTAGLQDDKQTVLAVGNFPARRSSLEILDGEIGQLFRAAVTPRYPVHGNPPRLSRAVKWFG
jgi:hypothetical protein